MEEKISAGATKIRRYEERKQFHQELDGRSNIPNVAPDVQEASEFSSNIWSIPGNFNENASWSPR